MNTNTIHKLADSLGVSWDGDKRFMDWCSQIVGKRHLDDMTPDELLSVYNELRSGNYPTLKKERFEVDSILNLMESEFYGMSTANVLNECTIVGTKMGGDVILAKNRDRNYNPKIKLIHEMINGIEVAYMLDLDTDYSEGMNEYGIGLVNATLQAEADENAKEKSKSKKGNIQSEDGFKIRRALGLTKISDVVQSVVSFTGYSTGRNSLSGKPTALNGHTIVGTPKNIFFIENVSNRPPIIKKLRDSNLIVRTNHGEVYSTAGYQKGVDRKSSLMRKLIAKKLMKKIHTPDQILPALNQKYEVPGWATPRRHNYKLWTSTQIMMNLTKLELSLVIDKDTTFLGVERRLDSNYDAKIKINVEFEHE